MFAMICQCNVSYKILNRTIKEAMFGMGRVKVTLHLKQ